MKIKLSFLIIISIAITVSAITISKSVSADSFSDNLKGKILLQVEENGEAWYINPLDSKRYYLGRPSDAFDIMRTLGLGISENSYGGFQRNGYNASYNLRGRILLRVEANGEAYYVDTIGHMTYLGRPSDAFNVMRNKGLGITNTDLNKIIIGKENTTPSPTPTPTPDPEKQEPPQHTDLETGVLIPLCTLENKCERYKGLSIYWTCDDRHLPAGWKVGNEGHSRVTCVIMNEKYITKSVAAAKRAIDKYPEKLWGDYLKRVYLVGGVRFNGKPAVGTVSAPDRLIYVGADEDDDYTEQVFHHELSSIIYGFFCDYKCDNDLKATNPSGFKYGDTHQITGKENLLKAGFARSYGMSNLENDVNTTAQEMFKIFDKPAQTGEYWTNLDSGKYPRLKAKFDRLVEMYHNVDPMFTEEYFRQISKQ